MLAVSADHLFADRSSILAKDLARVRLVQLQDHTAIEPQHADRTPGAPITAPGPFQEALTFVGAGQGALSVGAHARRYYVRPDVTYIPVSDALPLEWGLIWLADRSTARVRAFAEAAASLVHGHV
jgi:hypothetical protein